MKSTDFIPEKHAISQAAQQMHDDHEVQMAREQCYHAAANAIELHRMLRHVSEQQGLDGWVSEKITLANDYLRTVKEWLEYELMSNMQARVAEENAKPLVGEEASAGASTAGGVATNMANAGELFGGKKKTIKRKMSEQIKEEDAPPIHVRSLYAQTYAKHGKTAAQSKAAQELAYKAVEKKHGPEMRRKLSDYHTKNQNEEVEQITLEVQDLDEDAVADFLARGGKIQFGKLHKPRKAEKWQGSSHIGTVGGKGTKGSVSGMGANTNPKGGKPVVSVEEQGINENVPTTHEDPLVVVKKDGQLWTHANLSVVNHIHNTDVSAKEIHSGRPAERGNLTFVKSMHHDTEVKKDRQK